MYFKAIMLINIRVDYSALISAIQKNWKNETTNLAKAVLQIIKHFKYIKRKKKAQNVMQTSMPLIYRVLKSSCTNLKYIKKGLITNYTNYC